MIHTDQGYRQFNIHFETVKMKGLFSFIALVLLFQMVTSFATQENELFGSLVQEVKVEIDEIEVEVEVPNKNVEESYPPPTKNSVGAGCGCKQILISSLGEADHIQHGK